MAAAGGGSHTAAVAEDGTLFVWGAGANGVLGLGDCQPLNREAPARVDNLTAPVVQVAAGGAHTGIVTERGDLLMCGLGVSGRLGVGDETNRLRPTLLDRALFDSEAVVMVACGEDHTAVLTESSSVYTFGRGRDGQLGHGDASDDLLVPSRVQAAFNGEPIVMLAAGGSHTMALSEQGRVFTWGMGSGGRLGHCDEEDQRKPCAVYAWSHSRGHIMKGWMRDEVVFVAAGGAHSLAVTAGGRLFTWGVDEVGQLGQGGTDNLLVPTLVQDAAFRGAAVVMGACGEDHTMVVTRDGALWACGWGGHGRLGLNDEAGRVHFARVGAAEFGGARIMTAMAGVKHSAAVSEDGALWAWGAGGHGRLGHGGDDNQLVPKRILTSGRGCGDVRFGRCRTVSPQAMLAFAMGTHRRLGSLSKAHCSCLAGEPGLVALIARFCHCWPAGRAGEEPGLVRLLGGGALARREAAQMRESAQI